MHAPRVSLRFTRGSIPSVLRTSPGTAPRGPERPDRGDLSPPDFLRREAPGGAMDWSPGVSPANPGSRTRVQSEPSTRAAEKSRDAFTPTLLRLRAPIDAAPRR